MAVRRKKSGNEFLLIEALKELCAEKSISEDVLFDAIEDSLIFACKKNFGAEKKFVVDLDKEAGNFHVYEVRDIVMEVSNPYKEISVYDAKAVDPRYEVGDSVRREIPPDKLGRIAAQAAKQFVLQKIREAERGVVYDEFSNKDNDMVTGTVTRIDDSNIIVDIGKTEAILVPLEQMENDNFKIGDNLRAYVAEVRKMGKGPQVYLSRTHPALVRRLFELEVPEIQDGTIIIKTIVREAGNRSKMSVYSKDENIDAVGSCLGEHGIRSKAVSDELNGEKIDIIKFDEDPAVYIANALSPSKVMRVIVNENKKNARAVVPNNQLSLAIGKAGQNARLAARLTGWKIDIKSKTQDNDEPLAEDENLRVVILIDDKKKKKKSKSPAQVEDQNLQEIDSTTQILSSETQVALTGDEISPKKKKKKKKKKNPSSDTAVDMSTILPDFSDFDDVQTFDDDIPKFNDDSSEFGDIPNFDDMPDFGDDSFDEEK